MATLSSMKNIGKTIEHKLISVGVETAEQLREMGSKQAFHRLKASYPEVCLVHLYTLQAAIDGIEMDRLSESVKIELKAYSDSLK
ncbi:MAG: TfoX/Sxy family DNA transformation protein [Christensenellaceae bacterium]|jgi:DNA transformation protein